MDRPLLSSDPIDAIIAAWCSGSNVVIPVEALLASLPEDGAQPEQSLLLHLKALVTSEEWRRLPDQVAWRRTWLRKKASDEIEKVEQKQAQEKKANRLAAEREALHAAQQLLAERKRKTDAISTLRACFESDYLASDSLMESLDGLVDAGTYRKERVRFVQSWARSVLARGKKGEGFTLDDEQAFAVGATGKTIKVVARAGGGKTRTLVARAIFLTRHCHVPPGEILLLAFNRKAVLSLRRALVEYQIPGGSRAVTEELERRKATATRQDISELESDAVDHVAKMAGISLPHVFTFHALARAIAYASSVRAGKEVPDLLVDGGADESQSRAVQGVIDDHLRSAEFRAQVRDLMMDHFSEDWERIISGGYHLGRDEFIRFRASLSWETLAGEYVKSGGEKVIANFLFQHDIPYKYERNHTWSGVNYRPDFTLFKTDKSGVIVEYFGLAGDPDYDEMTDAKRQYWSNKNGWRLLEMSPNDLTGGIDGFNALLKSRLETAGVPCVPLSADQVWTKIRERAVDRFTRVMRGFLARCRKQMLSPEDLLASIQRHDALAPAEEKFIRLACRIYRAYLSRLQEQGEEDFDGLLARAATCIDAGETSFASRRTTGDIRLVSWLLVDEFQDFSQLFHRLTEAMRGANPALNVFCVGDDWQAINGFAGSELRYFNKFGAFFGASEELRVTTNYRSSAEVVQAGNQVMFTVGGPEARPHRVLAGPLLVGNLEDFQPDRAELHEFPGDWITPAVRRLSAKFVRDGRNVVLLNRTNFLGQYVTQPGARELKGFLEAVRKGLSHDLTKRVSTSTVHGYKGLESDVVIILDANVRRYPLIHPDWIFTRVLGDTLEEICAEERRLFYVAVTRAERTLVILTDRSKSSPFLEEIEKGCSVSSISWGNYPAVGMEDGRITVEVTNQPGRGTAATISINHLLKACNYRFDSVKKKWWKQHAREDLHGIEEEVWVAAGDGLEIEYLDARNVLIGKFLVDKGTWRKP